MNEVPGRIGESLPEGGAELLHSSPDADREAGLRDISGDGTE